MNPKSVCLIIKNVVFWILSPIIFVVVFIISVFADIFLPHRKLVRVMPDDKRMVWQINGEVTIPCSDHRHRHLINVRTNPIGSAGAYAGSWEEKPCGCLERVGR